MRIHKRWLLIVLATATLVRADTVVFDPDGGGSSGTVNVNSFQFGAGNNLMQSAVPFAQGNNFQFLFHSQLNSVIDDTGVQVTPVGPYEITVVGSVTESITTTSLTLPQSVSFKTATTQAPNSFV